MCSVRGRSDALLAGLVGVMSFALYLRTLAPDVLDGDVGEFQYAAYTLGLPHTTGYPFYMLVGRAWTILPIGSLAYRMNLLSAVFAAATIVGLYCFVRQVGLGRLTAIVAALTLAVSPQFWSQAIIAKAYTLNTLFIVIVLNLAIRARGSQGPRQQKALQAMAITLGLGLTHHRTFIFLLPGLLVYLWPALAGLRRRPGRLVSLVGLAVLPLALYLYIPLRAPSLGLQGSVNWALGLSYAQSFGSTAQPEFMSTLAKLGRLALEQYTILGAALAVFGLARLRARPGLLVLSGLTSLLLVFFFLGWNTSDPEKFLLPGFLFAAFWLGLGLEGIQQAFGRLFSRQRMVFAVLLPLLPLSILWVNFSSLDMSARFETARYWLEVIEQPMEQGAAIVGESGRLSPLRYTQVSHGLRGDVEAVGADLTRAGGWEILRHWLDRGRVAYLLDPLSRAPTSYEFAQVGPLTMIRLAGIGASRSPLPALAPLETDGIRLAGYAYEQPKIRAGGIAVIDVFWQLDSRPSLDYATYLHLIDERTGAMVAQHDKGSVDYFYYGYRTSRWPLGETMRDRFQLATSPELAPGAYRLEAGLYVIRDGTIANAARAHLGRLIVQSPLATIQPDKTPLAALGNVLRLVDAQVSAPEPLGAGTDIRVKLVWQSIQTVSEDYTIFVHLVDPSGRLIAQVDGPPSDGRYPTSLWDAGEVVVEERAVRAPEIILPGEYQLLVGAYTLGNQRRLVTPDGRDNVPLGTLRVR